MDLFITTFESVAVLLGIGFIGFWIIRRKIIPENILGILSPLALEIALPSLIFVNIIQGFSPSEYPDWWQLPLWWFLFTATVAVLTFVFMFLSKKETRREFGISLFFQNGIFFPLAIIAGMYPGEPSYLVFLFLFTLFFPAFFFNTYHLFFGKREKKLDWKKILHPVLIATIIAIIIRLSNLPGYIPEFAISIFQILGAMALPLIMIILGGNIYIDFQKKGIIHKYEIIKFIAIKNIVFPLAFLGILFYIHPDYIIALIILLQSAVPPVTSVPLVTERANGNRSIVNQFVVASFIFSLISIPLMIMLFSMFFSV